MKTSWKQTLEKKKNKKEQKMKLMWMGWMVGWDDPSVVLGRHRQTQYGQAGI